jgi:hypothetical protein
MRLAAAGVVGAVCAVAIAAAPGRAQERKPCDYGSHRPTPLRLGTVPAEVVPGRRVAYRVIARGYRGRLFTRALTRLTIRFERIDNAAETFSASLLRAYRRATPQENLGYDVRLLASSPGERAIVSWTDAGAKTPCTGELRTRDVAVVSDRRARTPVVSARSGETDARRGDSALLRVGARERACALTDPAHLTVVAKSAGVTKRVHLDMACGAWKEHAPLRVDRFTLLPEDGEYIGAARLYVSPRALPTPGAQLTLALYKGKRRLKTRTFSAKATASGAPQVVAG